MLHASARKKYSSAIQPVFGRPPRVVVAWNQRRHRLHGYLAWLPTRSRILHACVLLDTRRSSFFLNEQYVRARSLAPHFYIVPALLSIVCSIRSPIRKKVSLGSMFRGQTGNVWTKGVALNLEFENSATDEDGVALPVKVQGPVGFDCLLCAATYCMIHCASWYYYAKPYSGGT